MRNPLTGEDEEIVQPEQTQWNPLVKDYLLKRRAEREQLQKNITEESSGPNIAAGLAAIGAGFQGKDSLAAGQNFLANQRKDRAQRLTEFDSGTDKYIKENQLISDSDNKQRESDPMSQESILAQTLAKKMLPSKDFSKMSASQINVMLPTLSKIYDTELTSQLRRDAITANAQAKRDAAEAKKEAKELKEKELSTSELKQLGTYKRGILAEKQYADATSDTNEYDPTESGQWIDNSEWAPNWMKNNKAIEAQNAQSAWVETYLRDASGAAIAPSERMAYAKDYFPQPGDTDAVIKNKQALRMQQMENSRVASGSKAKNLDPDMSKTADQLLAGTYKTKNQKKKQSAEDALNWALANPNDPRAEAIFKKASPKMKAGF